MGGGSQPADLRPGLRDTDGPRTRTRGGPLHLRAPHEPDPRVGRGHMVRAAWHDASLPLGRAGGMAQCAWSRGPPQLFQEAGCLPMDPHFQPERGRLLIPLGAAAGAHRPATGYAFGTIQSRCNSIRDGVERALAEGQMPPVGRRPAVVRSMDRALLALLTRVGHRAPALPRVVRLLSRASPRALSCRPAQHTNLAAVVFATARGLCQTASEEPVASDAGYPPTGLPTLFANPQHPRGFHGGRLQGRDPPGSVKGWFRKPADSLSGAAP